MYIDYSLDAVHGGEQEIVHVWLHIQLLLVVSPLLAVFIQY